MATDGWTEAQENRLLMLRDEQLMSWIEIRNDMRRASVDYVRTKYYEIHAARRAARNLETRHEKCPNSALIDREKRRAAKMMQDFTGITFGDPPPGFSALDRMKGRVEA